MDISDTIEAEQQRERERILKKLEYFYFRKEKVHLILNNPSISWRNGMILSMPKDDVFRFLDVGRGEMEIFLIELKDVRQFREKGEVGEREA